MRGAGAVLAGVAFLALLWVLVVPVHQAPVAEPGPEDRVYQIAYGRVQCAQHVVTPCGVTLSKCQDTNIYLCLQNVRYESAAP